MLFIISLLRGLLRSLFKMWLPVLLSLLVVISLLILWLPLIILRILSAFIFIISISISSGPWFFLTLLLFILIYLLVIKRNWSNLIGYFISFGLYLLFNRDFLVFLLFLLLRVFSRLNFGFILFIQWNVQVLQSSMKLQIL